MPKKGSSPAKQTARTQKLRVVGKKAAKTRKLKAAARKLRIRESGEQQLGRQQRPLNHGLPPHKRLLLPQKYR